MNARLLENHATDIVATREKDKIKLLVKKSLILLSSPDDHAEEAGIKVTGNLLQDQRDIPGIFRRFKNDGVAGRKRSDDGNHR